MIRFTKGRIATLRTLYTSPVPLTAPEISRHTRAYLQTVSVHLDMFQQEGWVEAEGNKPRREGLTRWFTLTAHGRTYVKVLLEQQDG